MNHEPLDRLLRCAAKAPARDIPEPDPGLEARVIAAVRSARRAADDGALLTVLRWGLALAGGAALCAILLSSNRPASGGLEEAFIAPEPESYLALQ
jgi:hypothetical protein